ncbi:MAG: amidohydrolase/deacetylase family metallohydrolase [Verrucomicrobia bacterium]|nr:amidohydrolase/deacetylase family metallohydrolase [Verrucomicrobiota bacterium]
MKPVVPQAFFVFFALTIGGVAEPSSHGNATGRIQDGTPPFDLLLKGGHVIDPANKLEARMDLAIAAGKIARVAKSIPVAESRKVVDARGYYVAPGLIDIHTHVFAGGPDLCVVPDVYAVPNGVTTVVDAGSSGWKTFPEFKEKVIDRSTNRVLAFLNIVGAGMMGRIEQDENEMDPAAAAAMIKKFPDLIVGVKTAHFLKPGWTAVDRAVEAGKLSDTPVMVDFREVPGRSYEDLLLKHMRPGDIHTHLYAEHIPLLDEHGVVHDFARQARRRGVLFDVGHGNGSFWFRVAVPALKQGFVPDSISTDYHKRSALLPDAGMLTTMSKFLNLGMPLQEVVMRSTVNPAREIRRAELGTLSVGATADVAVLKLEKGKFGFVDSGHAQMPGNRRLQCLLTVYGGKVLWDPNGLSWPDWRGAGKYKVID